ncbi:hypothetical protein [Phenylobacterium sp.]|uniref:hypothetical protein n=1 Tax=Phenylobacterium sp. TaxID=1871053 RepID=UPI0025F1307C|nr:hypothetical protein [Phenylobacterium sp.]MBX3482132.1 hypothetical protein [Phenylobacterium sp.]MCW5760817.1 hypothetical protein [Phenylobacterium sp.]
MGGAAYHRGRAFEAAPRIETETRPLPRGYGLLLGATASVGLWAGIFWIAAAVFG